MGLSYDYSPSILLCAESNSSILTFDDEDDLGINGKAESCGFGKIYQQRTAFFRDPFMGFPLQSEECLLVLLEKESELLPSGDYVKSLMSGALDISLRKEAVDYILKVHNYHSFGPMSAYLSVNYLDRFLAAYELPQGKNWMTQLLAVACLSLAAKMEETEVPLSLDLQIGDAKYVFEAKTIQRMELLVLSTLKWRMRSVTPFSYIDYFIYKFNDGNAPEESEINRCIELILSTSLGIDLLEFRPSEVAAAVALTVLGVDEMFGMEKALNCCPYVNNASVMQCNEAIHDIISMEGKAPPSIPSVPHSPIGVLDAKCLSYKSDETTACSEPNSHNSSPAAKKRKVNSSSIS